MYTDLVIRVLSDRVLGMGYIRSDILYRII